MDEGPWGGVRGRAVGSCPRPEVLGERAECRLLHAPAREMVLCQQKEEPGLEQPELKEMKLSPHGLQRGRKSLRGAGFGTWSPSEAAGVGISSGAPPVPEP